MVGFLQYVIDIKTLKFFRYLDHFLANFGGLYLTKYGSYVSSDGRYGFIRCHRENFEHLKFFDFLTIFGQLSVPVSRKIGVVYQFR